MTGQQIIDNLPNVIGDSLDQDFTILLINSAKNAIEAELQLEITKKLDSSGSVSAGQTYSTARSLPADFFLPLPLYVGTEQYQPVPFEHQVHYRDTSGYYWIDLGNNQYRLCGTQPAANTIYFFYQKATTDLTSGTLGSWSPVWPSRFHDLILYYIAQRYFAFDQSEKVRSWLAEHRMFFTELKNQMIDWDAALKLNAINHSTPMNERNGSGELKIDI